VTPDEHREYRWPLAHGFNQFYNWLMESKHEREDRGDSYDIARAIREGFQRLVLAIETRAGEEQTRLILERICHSERTIMSAISEFSDRVNAKFDEIGASVDSAVTGVDAANTSLTGVAADVEFLKDVIQKLQTNPGPITPEDQALLDSAEARVGTLATKTTALKDSLGTLSTALGALDAATDSAPTPTPTP